MARGAHLHVARLLGAGADEVAGIVDLGREGLLIGAAEVL